MPKTVRQPPIQAITSLSLPEYEKTMLPNGMEMYMLRGGSEPVMKMEMVFRAGAWYEDKPGVSEFMSALMSEGTHKMTSAQLAEYIEYRGATIQTRGGVDTSRVRLFTLTRFLPQLTEVILDVIQAPLFDEDELKVYTANKIERLQIDLKKNEVLAYRHLTEKMYGPDHPYGRNIQPEDFQKITTADLHAHHQQYIRPERCMLFVSGSFGAKEIDQIEHSIGKWTPASTNGVKEKKEFQSVGSTGDFEYDGPQSHQAAIRIGRKLFTQDHPDYAGLFVVNTILGGYFGSRLMTEVRENLGLTYGIYSSMDSFAAEGCFYISTETATANIPAMMKAIGAEMDRLRKDLVPEEELSMARNYMMGHLMTQLDGPFSSLDFIRSMKIEGIEDQHFETFIKTIQAIRPEEIRALAKKYLSLKDWARIIVRQSSGPG